MGEATAIGREVKGRNRYKSRKGFYLGMQEGGMGAVRRPGNTPIRVLMADERCIPAVLTFLGSTGCGRLKEGVILSKRTP